MVAVIWFQRIAVGCQTCLLADLSSTCPLKETKAIAIDKPRQGGIRPLRLEKPAETVVWCGRAGTPDSFARLRIGNLSVINLFVKSLSTGIQFDKKIRDKKIRSFASGIHQPLMLWSSCQAAACDFRYKTAQLSPNINKKSLVKTTKLLDFLESRSLVDFRTYFLSLSVPGIAGASPPSYLA